MKSLSSEPMLPATAVVTTATLLGALAGGTILAAGCWAKDDCVAAGTCLEQDGAWCSYATLASPTSAVYFEGSNASFGVDGADAYLVSLMQGSCSPGEYMQRSSLSSRASCRSYFPYPNALNTAIQNQGAASMHDQACGAWIDASGPFTSPPYVYRSSSSYNSWLDHVRDVEDRSTDSAELSTRPSSKFRSECARTVEAGNTAIVASATLAYQHLRLQMGSIGTADDLLRAMAVLSRHYCDGPLSASLLFDSESGFAVQVVDLVYFFPGVLQQSLFSVGEIPQTQYLAEEATVALVDEINGLANAAGLSQAQIETFYRFASQQSDPGPVQRGIGTHSTPLAAILLDRSVMTIDQAAGYLFGAAAFCSFELRTQLDSGVGFAASYAQATAQLKSFAGERAKSSALGRVLASEASKEEEDGCEANGEERLVELSNASLLQAGRISFAQLRGTPAGDPDGDCFDFMRGLFADELDESRFGATVPPSLYARMEGVAEAVKQSLADEVLQPPLSDVYANAGAASSAVALASVRIAGAPRGSWGGLLTPLPDAGLATGDGVFVMALKQAAAVFHDRVAALAVNATSVCEHPTLVDVLSASDWQAYALSWAGCTVVMLGMAHRPWMDAEYDDPSLYSRAGWLIGHELAHVAMGGSSFTYRVAANSELLQDYDPQTYDEALADVAAALAIVRTGVVSNETLLLHVCQLWCARTAVGYQPSATLIHPGPNERCDFLADTIRRVLRQRSASASASRVLSSADERPARVSSGTATSPAL